MQSSVLHKGENVDVCISHLPMTATTNI